MPQIDGIIKERYTSDEIAEDLRDLIDADVLDPDDEDALERVAREFYFRGLVHGHASEEKVSDIRADFGY
ncbi:hypothetical protein ACFQH2_16690 [Natronoarchaeum sp. GCM10025703]|uniref:hypothetical protein n=1 Tax=unclassified Natronoarchaeum TaxID=2620183 RepID=UPI003606203E